MRLLLKHFSIYSLAKFLCLALIALPGLGTSFGQTSAPQAASLQESFRGTFQQESNSEVVFLESNGGVKYSTITQSFYKLVPQQEYVLNGIVVQKHLPNKAKLDDYVRLVQSAWPDIDSATLKYKAKKVEDWIRKNPEKPLVLMCSLHRADAPAGQGRKPIEISGKMPKPRLIKKVAPVYPDVAKQNRISGIVRLQVIIDEEGDVVEITPKSGDLYLIAAAIEAVQQWKFSPFLMGGAPVPAIVTADVEFMIH
jgi:TonB family protein